MTYVPLFQESERSAFWMLVHCVLVNKTRGSQAEPILARLRERWPNQGLLAVARPADVRRMIEPLGLSRARSASIIGLARAWLASPNPRRVTAEVVATWPGCGRYAADSWAIFVEGRSDVEPTDRRLKEYLERRRAACPA